jgi:NADH-quinone oxidoreductase subunit A
MSAAIGASFGVVAYLALFTLVGIVFLFANLLVGKFLRPHDPHAEKLEIYECGEPTIGSSFVQFDLRFYVVALLFIIFDVEVAFFFPWANVFGKATHLSDPRLPVVAEAPGVPGGELSPEAYGLFRELGIENPFAAAGGADAIRESAHQLAWLSLWDIGVFFTVLMVGFAYVWKRGDLDWVRAVANQRPAETLPPPPASAQREPAMMA